MGSNSDEYRCRRSDSLNVYGILMIKNIIPDDVDDIDISTDQIPEWRLPNYEFRGSDATDAAAWIVGADDRPTPVIFDFQGDMDSVDADDGPEFEAGNNEVNGKAVVDDDPNCCSKMAAVIGALMQDHPSMATTSGIWESNSVAVLTAPAEVEDAICCSTSTRSDGNRGPGEEGALNSKATTHSTIVKAGVCSLEKNKEEEEKRKKKKEAKGGEGQGGRKKRKQGGGHGVLQLQQGIGMMRRRRRISDDPQSVIARQRRQRIGDRIRVLQGLVPDAAKLDTASMLDKAALYLKYLQSQLLLRRQQQQQEEHHPLLFPPSSSYNNNNNNDVVTPPNPIPPPNHHHYLSYFYHHYHTTHHNAPALTHNYNPHPPSNYNYCHSYYPSPYPHPNPSHDLLLNNPNLSYPPFLICHQP